MTKVVKPYTGKLRSIVGLPVDILADPGVCLELTLRDREVVATAERLDKMTAAYKALVKWMTDLAVGVNKQETIEGPIVANAILETITDSFQFIGLRRPEDMPEPKGELKNAEIRAEIDAAIRQVTKKWKQSKDGA